jgi:UDP-GlcNAc:undecaprenyl-phosphate GlcNAc-1-phosphate transferase
MVKFLVPFLVSFTLSVSLICFSLWIFRKRNGWGIQSRDKIIRLGGLAIILSFNFAIFLDSNLFLSKEITALMAASLGILFFGIWDDIWEISWKVQLFFQTIVASLIFFSGIRIYYVTNPFFEEIINLDRGIWIILSFVVSVIWIVALINSLNWLDGIDGLSGGTAMIAALTIFFLSLTSEVNQPPVAILSMAFAGSILGFLVFNFNPAKIIAGTSGSMFMGFFLAVLAIFSGTKIATTLLVLFIPVTDFLWVIYARWKNGRSIFISDKNHLHHKLLSLGWSPKKINFVFYSITVIIAVISLNTRALGKSITLFLASVVLITVLVVLSRTGASHNLSLNSK